MVDRILYFVPHGDPVLALFKDSRHMVPAPCLLSALTLFFGMPKEDEEKFRTQKIEKSTVAIAPGATAVDPSRHVMEQHRAGFRISLHGSNLNLVMARVTDRYIESIASDAKIKTDEWSEVPDLHDFMATRIFEAVTRVIFGDGMMKVCPDIYKDFWAFYEALPTLLLKVPRWMNPGSWAARDKMHQNMIKWRHWCERQPRTETVSEDDIFDPIFGMAMTRRLSEVYQDIGLGEIGVAAAVLSYFSV